MYKINVPYIYEVDETAVHIEKCATPLKMPKLPSELKNACSLPDFHIELIGGNKYLRSKKDSLFCESLIPKSIYISMPNEFGEDIGGNIYAFEYDGFAFAFDLGVHKIFLVDAYKSEISIVKIPPLLNLLYFKAKPSQEVAKGIFNYKCHMNAAETSKNVIYDEELRNDIITFGRKFSSINNNSKIMNPYFSDYFENNPSLMSDSEYEGLNGQER